MKKVFLLVVLFMVVASFKKKDLTWVAIGDSITYLNDHVDETGNRITKGYMTRVTEKLHRIHFINQGHNGWTSGGIADAIDSLGLVKADVYSVFFRYQRLVAGPAHRPVYGLPKQHRQSNGVWLVSHHH